MELTKTKFKQTEVGLIPEDWNLVLFESIFSFYSTSNYSKAQMSETDEVGCIHYGLIHAIKNTNFDLKDGVKYYVTSEQAKYELVRDGDVIMVDASEDLEGINKSVEVFGVGNNKYISGLHTYLLRDKKSLIADNFRGVILNSQSVKNQMLQLAVGMKVFGVSKTQLINVKIPLPPLPEQKAIAQVLSDTDSLLQTLEQKIAKKRAIKQGAMQQLLTPNPDSDAGDWEVRKLGDVFNLKQGVQCGVEKQSRELKEGLIRFIRIIDLTQKNEPLRYIEDPGSSYHINEYDLFMVRYGNPGLLGFGYKGVIANNLFILQPKVNLNELFFYHLLSFNNNKILELSSSTTMAALNFTSLRELKIHFPNSINVQTQIATILSDMDAEIEQLEQKLEKYKLLKQGLMQELLTGRIRLI